MKKLHIVAIVIIAGLLAYVVVTSTNYSTYENFATASKLAGNGREFQVVGLLSRPAEMHYDPQTDPNFFSFYMKDDKGLEKQVVYRAPKPRDFERSEQIVLTGQMVGDTFQASKILLKCPSKYIEEGVGAKQGEFTEFSTTK
ncbi:MAG: cytochrome c maturation protein CcmE [Sphingobacteriales bacterium]|jgi:cytochrome c-type biogenesis protein CcmE|nr:cytochrome c maturation protein CcmE [Sphingobacteriales bacterium]MBP9142107.1 cytochrome c maturation protein CcmE [Chitinophagales bacterium]MDA0199308.1 cytochrome c maturation protein CcmE [Bacteroidota bacterium]MBK6889651.1 cytochrome c maturation protein CcmE [Sphingobacteriales bacterium]MBK7527836.1 cytochrome c maturation protein CcmE [Sphingobacteriales bacterium]